MTLLVTAWLTLGVLWRIQLDGAEQSQIDNGVLYLPKASGYLKERKLKQEDSPFFRFDGSYPEGWPDGFSLPSEVYLLESSSLPGNANGKPLEVMPTVVGVSKASPIELIDCVRSFALQNDWEIDSPVTTSPPLGKGLLYLRLTRLHTHNFLHKLADGRIVSTLALKDYEEQGLTTRSGWLDGDISLGIWEYESMDGWIYFELRAISGRRDIPQTEEASQLPVFINKR